MGAHFHPSDLEPGQEVDGFRIIQRIDQGCTGHVFEVERAGLKLALKFDRYPQTDVDPSQAMTPLQREVVCLLGLQHRHIARILGSSAWPNPCSGYRYMLYELVDGPALDIWAAWTYPTPHQLVVLLDKVCSALESMHRRHIFHRNLNLRNIVVARTSHEPLLVDFSYGDFAEVESLRNERMPPGLPRYPSPEAECFWAYHRYDPRARYVFLETDEIFALGAMLYELLTWAWTGYPYLFEPRTASEGRLPAPLDVTRGRVPPSLSDFTLKLTAWSPRERPADMGEVRRMLADLKKRDGAMWHTPFYPAPARAPRTIPLRERMRLALARATYSLKWRGLWLPVRRERRKDKARRPKLR